MSLSLSSIGAGDDTQPATFRAPIFEIRDFLNVGIESADLDQDAWVETQHVIKPNFFGFPAPRMESVIADVHMRGHLDFDRVGRSAHHGVNGLDQWQTIKGMSDIVKMPRPGTVRLVGGFYFYEAGAANGHSAVRTGIGSGGIGGAGSRCGYVKAFINGGGMDGARRRLWAGGGGSYRARQRRNILADTVLGIGQHTLEIKLKPVVPDNTFSWTTTAGAGIDWKHLWVEFRAMVAVVEYL